MKNLMKSQRGFTLLELVVVMSIIGVLAGVVAVAVSGTGDTSSIAQARADASTVQNAASTFFTDQVGIEVLSPRSVAVTAAIGSALDLDPESPTFGEVTYDIELGEAVDDETQTFTQQKSTR
jgi:prepilin-type N-terminal cleavage/methylation domain-containing protein